jgi:hypothetical protein
MPLSNSSLPSISTCVPTTHSEVTSPAKDAFVPLLHMSAGIPFQHRFHAAADAMRESMFGPLRLPWLTERHKAKPRSLSLEFMRERAS